MKNEKWRKALIDYENMNGRTFVEVIGGYFIICYLIHNKH